MHFKNFDLNLLVALDALLATRNVTRAAELLSVTQPTMSNALQRIRDHFADEILSRSGRGMELTPLAADLAPRVRELLLHAAGVLDTGWLFDPSTATRVFRVVMSDYCAMLLMPPLVRHLTRVAPNVRCELVPLSGRGIEGLLAGEVDLCITAQNLHTLHPASGWHVIELRELFHDRFVCAVADDHPEIRDALTLEQFIRFPHAVVRFENGVLSIEEWTLQRLDLEIMVSAVAGTFAMLPTLVPGTCLIATIQERLADRVGKTLRLRCFPPPIEIPDLTERMLWHRRSARDQAHQWFRTVLKDIAASLDLMPALAGQGASER